MILLILTLIVSEVIALVLFNRSLRAKDSVISVLRQMVMETAAYNDELSRMVMRKQQLLILATDSMPVIAERAAWVAKNTAGPWTFNIDDQFKFENDDDAILYKMRWEGEE